MRSLNIALCRLLVPSRHPGRLLLRRCRILSQHQPKLRRDRVLLFEPLRLDAHEFGHRRLEGARRIGQRDSTRHVIDRLKQHHIVPLGGVPI